MADADEDTLPNASSTSTNPYADDSTDLTDEAQDYRFLSTLSSNASDPLSPTLPRRGLKDFEPLPTLSSQSTALDAARQAMHAALSFPRAHASKHHVVGVYLPEEAEWRAGRCVRVDSFRGVHGRTMGQSDRWNRVWLYGEEALFLLERGSLDVRWPAEMSRKRRKIDRDEVHDDEEGGGGVEVDQVQQAAPDPDEVEQGIVEDVEERVPSELPMSLQGAYASFLGKGGLTLERYTVFAGLRRLGYTVTRAPTWSDENVGSNGHARPPASRAEAAESMTRVSNSPVSDLVNRLLQYLFKPDQSKACPSLGPLVAPGLYRNYGDIFRVLSLVPFHEPAAETQHEHLEAPFRIAYHVFKPNTPYRKSSPPQPDFRVAVIDARSSSVPTMEQIGALLDSMPLDELPKEKRLEQRLKHGKRNVILAIVDTGVVSYLRFSESGFGSARLYEEKAAKGRKGAHRPRGKGR